MLGDTVHLRLAPRRGRQWGPLGAVGKVTRKPGIPEAGLGPKRGWLGQEGTSLQGDPDLKERGQNGLLCAMD